MTELHSDVRVALSTFGEEPKDVIAADFDLFSKPRDGDTFWTQGRVYIAEASSHWSNEGEVDFNSAPRDPKPRQMLHFVNMLLARGPGIPRFLGIFRPP